MERLPEFTSDFTETELTSKLAYQGGLLRVHRDEVRLPDGKTSWREYVVHPGAVMMLAFVDDETVLLERQFRYPQRRHFIELPAGKLEPGEPGILTAKRELVEECGFEAEQWWHICTLHPSIGYSTEIIDLYGARGLRHVGARLDEGEHLEVMQVKVSQALEWIAGGMVTDTKTTFGLLWWDKFGKFP